METKKLYIAWVEEETDSIIGTMEELSNYKFEVSEIQEMIKFDIERFISDLQCLTRNKNVTEITIDGTSINVFIDDKFYFTDEFNPIEEITDDYYRLFLNELLSTEFFFNGAGYEINYKILGGNFMFNIGNQKITVESKRIYEFDKIDNLYNKLTLINDICIEGNTISLFNQDVYEYETIINNKEELQQWFNMIIEEENLKGMTIEVF